jgi:hypothetical protein
MSGPGPATTRRELWKLKREYRPVFCSGASLGSGQPPLVLKHSMLRLARSLLSEEPRVLPSQGPNPIQCQPAPEQWLATDRTSSPTFFDARYDDFRSPGGYASGNRRGLPNVSRCICVQNRMYTASSSRPEPGRASLSACRRRSESPWRDLDDAALVRFSVECRYFAQPLSLCEPVSPRTLRDF